MVSSTRFEVIAETHGEGGFGKIQKRQDNILDRVVAVKSLKLLKDKDARERFVREAKMLARIAHPNIPAIYDVEFLNDEMRIIFEFIDGDNLRSRIAAKSIPTIEQARNWFTQIASALGYAHQLNIIHRDVKPENIVISPEGNVATLVDFGIALTRDEASRLTGTGYVIGTPGYMSPEQEAGLELDGRSDIYSLGITLYETLAGHLPHAGVYELLSESNEAIPPSVDDLIQKAIVHDRTRRIQKIEEFIDELRAATRLDVPFSSLLTDARLHEILGALSRMSAEDFHAKPLGQRLLVINRMKDLARIDKPELRLAAAALIESLVRLAVLESDIEYKRIIQTGFEWGFDKVISTKWTGNQDIRAALIDVSKTVETKGHNAFSDEFIKYMKSKALAGLPSWHHHDLRKIVVGLLANPHCSGFAEELASLYDQLNVETH